MLSSLTPTMVLTAAYLRWCRAQPLAATSARPSSTTRCWAGVRGRTGFSKILRQTRAKGVSREREAVSPPRSINALPPLPSSHRAMLLLVSPPDAFFHHALSVDGCASDQLEEDQRQHSLQLHDHRLAGVDGAHFSLLRHGHGGRADGQHGADGTGEQERQNGLGFFFRSTEVSPCVR